MRRRLSRPTPARLAARMERPGGGACASNVQLPLRVKAMTPGAPPGFTRIELLVVIGIIAALGALVSSVSVAAKDTAKRVSCASNLRQLDLAMHLYALGYDERLPPYINHEGLLSILDPDVTTGGNRPTDSLWPSSLRSSLMPYSAGGAVWFCPGDQVAGRSVCWLQIRHEFTSYEYRTPIVFFLRRMYAGQWAGHPRTSCSSNQTPCLLTIR